mmetsp:Transcript_11767/g.28880  ORF Transcript_11767/g.28880 Transcript_11767/m.28880 type:complete len:403 (+) Transcript_11767:149-1357(+)
MCMLYILATQSTEVRWSLFVNGRLVYEQCILLHLLLFFHNRLPFHNRLHFHQFRLRSWRARSDIHPRIVPHVPRIRIVFQQRIVPAHHVAVLHVTIHLVAFENVFLERNLLPGNVCGMGCVVGWRAWRRGRGRGRGRVRCGARRGARSGAHSGARSWRWSRRYGGIGSRRARGGSNSRRGRWPDGNGARSRRWSGIRSYDDSLLCSFPCSGLRFGLRFFGRRGGIHADRRMRLPPPLASLRGRAVPPRQDVAVRGRRWRVGKRGLHVDGHGLGRYRHHRRSCSCRCRCSRLLFGGIFLRSSSLPPVPLVPPFIRSVILSLLVLFIVGVLFLFVFLLVVVIADSSLVIIASLIPRTVASLIFPSPPLTCLLLLFAVRRSVVVVVREDDRILMIPRYLVRPCHR